MGSDSPFGERTYHEHDGPDCCPPPFRVPTDPTDRKLLAELEACNEYLRGRLAHFREMVSHHSARAVKAEARVAELERMLGQLRADVERLNADGGE